MKKRSSKKSSTKPPARRESTKKIPATPIEKAHLTGFDEVRFSRLTRPKPFIFVLMPFLQEFNDIYTYGIKGAAEEVGAYAERVDEQDYVESILDRIYNQINKADIIVADMTGQNPNVFYEVGYAHALGKIVLLLTQNANDIPFDLKHRPHTIYGGGIEHLRAQLKKRLIWAISELQKERETEADEIYDVSIRGMEVQEGSPHSNAPLIFRLIADKTTYSFRVVVRNGLPEIISGISHIYLFAESNTHLKFFQRRYDKLSSAEYTEEVYSDLEPFKAHPFDAKDGLINQYRIEYSIPALPPGVSETFEFNIRIVKKINEPKIEERLRLRLHSETQIHDFPFKLEVRNLR